MRRSRCNDVVNPHQHSGSEWSDKIKERKGMCSASVGGNKNMRCCWQRGQRLDREEEGGGGMVCSLIYFGSHKGTLTLETITHCTHTCVRTLKPEELLCFYNITFSFCLHFG